MRILVVSFSVNGAMGDNFFLLTKFFSKPVGGINLVHT